MIKAKVVMLRSVFAEQPQVVPASFRILLFTRDLCLPFRLTMLGR